MSVSMSTAISVCTDRLRAGIFGTASPLGLRPPRLSTRAILGCGSGRLSCGAPGFAATTRPPFDAVRQVKYARFPVADRDISEEYDLVIVGGGISGLAGLSAAHFYRTAFGANQRILISTIRTISAGTPSAMNSGIAARTYIGCGGTLGIATLYPYSYAAKARSYGGYFRQGRRDRDGSKGSHPSAWKKS